MFITYAVLCSEYAKYVYNHIDEGIASVVTLNSLSFAHCYKSINKTFKNSIFQSLIN